MTHEFASPAWIDEARRSLTAVVDPVADALRGVRFAICEIYSDPPATLVGDDRGALAWHFVIEDGHVEVGHGARDDVDHTVRADYHVAIPYAKQPSAEQAKTFASLRVPDELRTALMAFHDRMAAVTR